MKLDKIKFARLVHFITNMHPEHDLDLEQLDYIVDIEVPEQATIEIYPKNENVERLMALIAGGTNKIEAIREHRAITGMGLKESKDAVERYWPNSTVKKYSATDLRSKLNSSVWSATEYSMIENFLQSL